MNHVYSPFSSLDRLLDDVMTGITGTSLGTAPAARTFSPAFDVRANQDELVFVADVPGLKNEDIDVTLDQGVLTISGQRRYDGSGKDKVLLGRSYGAFKRAFTLPDTVDAERLTAELSDGVLTVRVAQQPKAKPRKISISPRSAELKSAEAKGEPPQEG